MKALRNVVIAALIAGGAGVVMAMEKAPEAVEKPPEKGAEVSIPFVNMNRSIQGWQADGQTALWIQDAHNRWYYAKLMAPCQGLEFTSSLGFEPKTMNSLDKFGYVVMPDRQRCPISSLTRSDEPPKEKKAGKSDATK